MNIRQAWSNAIVFDPDVLAKPLKIIYGQQHALQSAHDHSIEHLLGIAVDDLRLLEILFVLYCICYSAFDCSTLPNLDLAGWQGL